MNYLYFTVQGICETWNLFAIDILPWTFVTLPSQNKWYQPWAEKIMNLLFWSRGFREAAVDCITLKLTIKNTWLFQSQPYCFNFSLFPFLWKQQRKHNVMRETLHRHWIKYLSPLVNESSYHYLFTSLYLMSPSGISTPIRVVR